MSAQVAYDEAQAYWEELMAAAPLGYQSAMLARQPTITKMGVEDGRLVVMDFVNPVQKKRGLAPTYPTNGVRR